MKHRLLTSLRKIAPRGIQTTLMLAFSLIAISLMFVMGIVMYLRFYASSRQDIVSSTQKLLEQSGENLEDYLVSMRQISDAVYYNVVKEYDLTDQEQNLQTGMNLIYEANNERLRGIALYNSSGSLLTAEPVASQKEDPNVTRQDWYEQAVGEMENMHFSTPHIQNLFDDGTLRYYWVISLSRVVEVTEDGVPQTGVLLVDMDYASISRMMKQINETSNGQYYYLCDESGQIIYHSRQVQISRGLYQESNLEVATYKDGIYDDLLNGVRRKVIVNTISYTGWKLIGVIPQQAFTQGMGSIRYFFAILILLMAMMLVIINRLVSLRISRPILKLNDSVLAYEAGQKPEIYISGSPEIRHLGRSIEASYEQIDALMKKIVQEQTDRRKSELDALQSQINPHFLYNALDSIVWMVEGGRNDEAAFMISELARFFRISLSKGKTIISVKDELQHARSYMHIQKIRYKNAFSVSFDIDPEIEDYCTVKLILQPILENAINYGVGDADDGQIVVSGCKSGDDIVLSVQDNGLGMSEETVRYLLTDSTRVRHHGSGVGLINVNQRIQLLFGPAYGLEIISEPDVGTLVSVHLPAIPYTEENRQKLEQGQPDHPLSAQTNAAKPAAQSPPEPAAPEPAVTAGADGKEQADER